MDIVADDDLISFFNSIFEFDYTRKDFELCKPEFVQIIYTFFLKDFGVSLENIGQIPFDAPATIQQHPEMYRNTCNLLRLSKCIKFVLDSVYPNNDFTLMDVIDPDRYRSRKFFSVFVHFYNFLGDQLPLFEEVDEEVATKNEKLISLKGSIEQYKLEFHKKEMQGAESQVNLQKVMKDLQIEKEEIEQVQELKNRLKGRLAGLNTEIQDVKTQLNEMKLKVLETKDKRETLKSKVVSEDERLAIEDRKSKVSAIQDENNEQRSLIMELKQSLQIQQKAEDILNKTLIPSLQEYENEIKKKMEMLSVEDEEKREIASLSEKDEELLRALQMLSESVTLHNQELTRLQSSHEVLKKSTEEEIHQLKLTLEELVNNNEKHEIVEKDLTKERENHVEQTKILQANLEDYLSSVKSFILNLATEFEKSGERQIKELKSEEHP